MGTSTWYKLRSTSVLSLVTQRMIGLNSFVSKLIRIYFVNIICIIQINKYFTQICSLAKRVMERLRRVFIAYLESLHSLTKNIEPTFFVLLRLGIIPLQPSFAFHKETSHLICIANQVNGFFLKCKNGLKWV